MIGSTTCRAIRVGEGRAIGVLLVIAALVVTCGSPAPSVAPGSPSLPSASPTASTGSGPSPTSEPPADQWDDVSVTPLARVASLDATKSGLAGAALDTAFRLTSLDGRDPSELASRLVAEPALELKVGKAAGNTVALKPTAPLVAGQLYRFALRGSVAGTTEASWAVQAVGPLHVVSSIPYDEATQVPLDTGIEITFDQAGVDLAQFERRFSISPETAGRFEQHGRTIVFVPDRPLKGSRLYTVTLERGLPLAGTGMRLEDDVVIRFETEGRRASDVHLRLARALFDAGTQERAVITVFLDEDDEDDGGGRERVRSVEVKVHRLPGLEAAIRAYDAIDAAPDWTWLTATAPVRTAGLPRVLSGTLSLKRNEYPAWLQLPRRLSAGWYVATVTHAGVPRQAVLQVTDLATYATLTTSRMAVWVNDLRTDDPVRGASVTLAGRSLGSTDADGLLVRRTPPSISDETESSLDTTLIVRKGARAAFVPVGRDWACGKCWDDGYGSGSGGTDAWWQLFTTDRYRYRTTDTVNLWGVVREREGGAVPSPVSLALFVQDWSDSRRVPIDTVTAKPDRTGSFVARLPFQGLPSGDYALQLRVAGEVLAERSIHVGPIAKPAWQMTLTTDRHAVISGASVEASIDARFFEGTPVAGVDLRVGGYSEDDDGEGTEPLVATTDAAGAATVTVPLRGDSSQWDLQEVYARPTAPEEGEIGTGTRVAVFASSALVTANGTLDGKRLVIEGAVHSVAFERFEAPGLDSLWDVDPSGAPRAGARVRVHVVESIPVVTQTGTRYDFITKRVEPVYEYDERTVDLGTRTATTAADGTYHLELTVAGGRRSYSVTATYRDEAGRSVSEEISAYTERTDEDSVPFLAPADDEYRDYGVGETVRVTFRRGAEDVPVSRYLYLVEHLGLRSATVSDRARFATRFDASAVPSLYIAGVRFTGSGYEVAGSYSADYRSSDRRLVVAVTPDRGSYAPGDRAALGIRTTGPDGRPVAASVFVRVVDERLYAIDGAGDVDPLHELYVSVGSGVLASAWSHRNPLNEFEGGDTTGGGGDVRDDFRDWLAAELVTTGADGRASLDVDLSDDLTSWRAVAQAVDAKLQAGLGTARVAVSLPLFAEATIAAEYLSADRPVIRVRAYGTGLSPSDRVTFQVSSDTLPMATLTTAANAFEAIEVPLPALSVGEHRVRIRATSGSGAAAREDVLVRTFRVVETRTVEGRTTYAPLVGATGIDGGTGLATVTLVDAGRGRVVPLLQSLVWTTPDRADRAVAASVAADLLRDAFGLDREGAVPDPDLGRFQRRGGFSVVPWADADLELSVLVALSGDERIDRSELHWYLSDREHEEDEDGGQPIVETRERALWRLAGQAALGEPVLADVRIAAAISDLTPGERLTVALAALAAGDEELAATLMQDLLERHGQRLGPWVRLHGIAGVEDAVATARLAIVAASLGDPLAADMDAYVEANPPKETVVDLERAIAARGWAARVPGASAKVAVTVDGRRQELAISPDRPARFTLTPTQAASARLEPVTGSVLVITSGEEPFVAGSLAAPDGVTLARTVVPGGAIGATDTVVVTYDVTVEADALAGCWSLTDFVPSGLVPIDAESGGYYDDEEFEGPRSEGPWRVEGQRVDFCVTRDPTQRTHTLRYLARVVTPGAYAWEATVLQSSIARDQGIVLAPTTVTIAGLGG